MTRTLYDSTNPNDIPADASLIGYYCDGIYAVSEPYVRARFPTAALVAISAVGTNAGIAGDVEPGCMTPAQSVEWVKARRAAGVDPTLYVNQTYGWGPLSVLFRTLGVAAPHWWVADYDGIAVVPVGAVAKQYANPTLTGGHFDLSVCLDFWPGVDEAHGPATGAIAPRRVISLATLASLQQWVRGTDRALWHRRRSGGTWSNWVSLGGVLASEIIVPGVDGQGHLVVSVLGTDAKFYDYTSLDDGATWSSPVNNGGGGDGLVALSAAPVVTITSTSVDLSPVETKLDALGRHLGVGNA